MKTELIDEFNTTRTEIFVYKTDISLNGETLFVIRSFDKSTEKEYIRYGNKQQYISLKKSYLNPPKEFKLYD